MGLFYLLLTLSCLLVQRGSTLPQTYFGTTKTFTELDSFDFTQEGSNFCDEACQNAYYQAFSSYNQIFSKEDQDIFKQLEAEANLFEYQLMMQQQPNSPTLQSGVTNQLPPVASADHHAVAADQMTSKFDPAGGSQLPSFKQLPTVFQWDFRTTTAEPSVGKSANQPAHLGSSFSVAATSPPAKSAITTKAPRAVVATTAAATTTRPTARPTASTTAGPESEVATTAVSRVPKIYVKNPKIDPFTEPPALVPEVGGTPPPNADGASSTKRPSFKIKLKLPKKEEEEENSRVKKTIEPADEAANDQLLQKISETDIDGDVSSSEEESQESELGDNSATAFTSINSIVDRPKFKFADLLEESETSTANSRQTPPDSFKFFAAVPGTAST